MCSFSSHMPAYVLLCLFVGGILCPGAFTKFYSRAEGFINLRGYSLSWKGNGLASAVVSLTSGVMTLIPRVTNLTSMIMTLTARFITFGFKS